MRSAGASTYGTGWAEAARHTRDAWRRACALECVGPPMCRAFDLLRAVLKEDAGEMALEDVACARESEEERLA